jgi:hypothetical protein
MKNGVCCVTELDGREEEKEKRKIKANRNAGEAAAQSPRSPRVYIIGMAMSQGAS